MQKLDRHEFWWALHILSIFGERCTAPCRVEHREAKGGGVDCIAFSHKAGWCNVKLHLFNFLGYASIPRMLRETARPTWNAVVLPGSSPPPQPPTPVAVTSKWWISQVRRFRYYNTSWFDRYPIIIYIFDLYIPLWCSIFAALCSPDTLDTSKRLENLETPQTPRCGDLGVEVFLHRFEGHQWYGAEL